MSAAGSSKKVTSTGAQPVPHSGEGGRYFATFSYLKLGSRLFARYVLVATDAAAVSESG